MDTVIFIVVFVAIATAIFALGAAVISPASPISYRIQWLLGRTLHPPQESRVTDRVEKVLQPLGKLIPQSPDAVSRTRAQLIQAGYRELRHVYLYSGIRVLLALVWVVAAAVSGILFRSPLLVLLVAALVYILPGFVLQRMIAKRQLQIQLALPDGLDLAVICVEAGLGLDQAISRVGTELQHAHPALSDELQLVNIEMRAGKPRAEALRNLALRTGVDDIRAFVAVLVQTDRFGTSVANALRVHSDTLRTERRQRAEERAAKTTIKMVPPLVFFVFPAMFIVTLGPAIIALVRQILPTVNR